MGGIIEGYRCICNYVRMIVMKQNEFSLLRSGALLCVMIFSVIATVFTVNYFQNNSFTVVNRVEERFGSVAGLDGAVSSLQ